MTKKNPVQAFECPSCGASLDVEAGKATVKCQYCNETVFIPSLLHAETPHTPKPAPRQPVRPRPSAQTSFDNENVSHRTSRRGSFSGRVVTFLIALILLGGIVSLAFGFNPFAFASKAMTFGSEGIGPGMFEAPRAIGVDDRGNIVVADFDDGRVQTFDPEGNFVSTFTVKKDGKAAYISDIAVSHDGRIYIPAGDILIFDESGREVGKIDGDMHHSYNSVALGADGAVYALTFADDVLVRFDADGAIDLEIPNAVSNVTGDRGGFPRLAVDGLGNMYIASPSAIIKYSPEGKFIDQFGGKAKNAAEFEPGKFVSPLDIDIDGYGRIFVADSYSLQVFDSNGKYLKSISGGYYGIAFDGQNNLYTTPVTKNNVVKFRIKKPAQQ